MDIHADVPVVDELGYDEDAIIGVGSTAETDEETDVGVPALLHETPFSLEIFCDIVFLGGEDFLDGDLDAEVDAWEGKCERVKRGQRKSRPL